MDQPGLIGDDVSKVVLGRLVPGFIFTSHPCLFSLAFSFSQRRFPFHVSAVPVIAMGSLVILCVGWKLCIRFCMCTGALFC